MRCAQHLLVPLSFSLDNIDVPLSVSIRSMGARVSNPQRHFQKKKKYCFIIYIRNRERGRINNWKDIFTGLPLLLGWEKHRNSVAKNEEGKERDRGRASLNREKMARDPCAQSQRLFCLSLDGRPAAGRVSARARQTVNDSNQQRSFCLSRLPANALAAAAAFSARWTSYIFLLLPTTAENTSRKNIYFLARHFYLIISFEFAIRPWWWIINKWSLSTDRV